MAEKLDIIIGAEVVVFKRLRSADDQPLMIVMSILPCTRVPNIESHVLLSKTYGHKLDLMVRIIEAIAASKPEASLLNIKPERPVQYTETIVYTANDIPIEFSLGWYRGDHSPFTSELPA